MAIKKYHRNEGREDYTSKTSIKLDAQEITKWGQQLSEMQEGVLAQLPIEETTFKALLDYKKMTSNLAKKRHLMFIGKCLRKENEDLIRETLESIKNKSQQIEISQLSKVEQIANQLLQQDLTKQEEAVESLLRNHSGIERQTLRQLVRNYNNAKQDKRTPFKMKLQKYLEENG